MKKNYNLEPLIKTYYALSKDLKNKFVYQLLAGLSQVMVPLISYPYITRVLGPENIGKINYADFLTQMFIIFAAFGIPVYGIREIALLRNEPLKRAFFIKEMLLLHLGFSFLTMVAFSFITFSFWDHDFWLYQIALLNIFSCTFLLDWYFQGMEAFGFVAIRQLIVRSAVMICFFIFIKQTTDYTLYFALHSAGLVTMVILNVRRVFTENNWPLHKPELKKHLAPLFHFFLTSSAITLYIYFDTFLLQKITNDHSLVGYYTTAVKLVKIFLVGLLALGTILLPRISYLVSSGDMESVKKHLNKNLELIIVIGLPISIGILLLAPEAVVVIAGEKFSPATPLLQIMSFIPLVISISNLFCFQTLIPFKKEKFFLVVVLLGCVVSISLNLLLIPIFSAKGSAYANIITESTIAILSGIFAYRSLQFKINTKMVLQCIFCCLFFIPVIFICRNYFHNNLITFCISITACPLLYFLMQRLIFKNTTIRGIEDYVIQLIRRN